MRGLVTIAVLLAVAWFVGLVVFKVAGFFIHVLLIVAVIMLVLGLIRRVRNGISSGR